MNGRRTRSPRRWLQALHAALANPAATVVLLMFLWIDAAVIGQQTRSHSLVVGWLRAALPGLEARRTTGPHPIWRWWAVREPERFRLFDPDNESWDEATRLIVGRPDDAVRVTLWRITTTEGFWAPTHRTTNVRLMFSPMGADFPAHELATLRRQVLAERPPPAGALVGDDASNLAVADFRMEDTLWLGYAHSGAALLALLGLVYSLRWIPRTPAWIRARRRDRAERKGRCPRCGYSVAGLPEPRCPECGENLAPRPDAGVTPAPAPAPAAPS